MARRRVFVDLVEEDKAHFGADRCGLLLKSMYGTQDASNIWQDDYTELLCSSLSLPAMQQCATMKKMMSDA